MLKQILQDKTRQGYALSAIFAVLLAVHLLSSDITIAGKTFAEIEEGEDNHALIVPKVKVKRIKEEAISQSLLLYGRTEANRSIQIKSELASTVNALVAKEGQTVKKGQTLLTLDKQNVKEQLKHAKAFVKQKELEYEASQTLKKKGFYNSGVKVADSLAQLNDAKSLLKKLQLNHADTTVRSPFAGIVNKLLVEEGDYLGLGDPVAHVLDLNPLVITVYIPETNIHEVAPGQSAQVTFLSNEQVEGTIRFIGKQSFEATNTFLAEVVIDNADYRIPAGITAKVSIDTLPKKATKVSPATLTLNDEGAAGLFVVEDNKAIFKPVSILHSTVSELWVDSVGDDAKVITVGQQSLREGAPVQVVSEE